MNEKDSIGNTTAEIEATPLKLLGSPFASFLSHVVAPLISLAAMARTAWLGWTEFEPATLASVIVLVALPVVCAVGSMVILLARGRRQFPLWADAVSVFLAGFFCAILLVSQDDISATLPNWMVGSGSFLLGYAGMMAVGFSSIWRLGILPLKIGKVTDIGATVLGVIVVPIMTYVVVRMIIELTDVHSSDIRQNLVLPVLVIALIVLFILIFRFFGLLFSFLEKFRRHRFIVFAEALVTTTVLPFAGLALNADMPFPADFQYVWFYLATALTALVLMVSDGKSDMARLTIWFARWAAMPFTLYFFIVFLPFLPFSVLAMFFFGAGILILAPTLLFWRHARTLNRSMGGVVSVYGKRVAVVSALVAFLLIPGAIAVVTEIHRADLQRAIAFVQEPDYDTEAKLPVSHRRAEAVVQRAVDFNNGRDIPLISAWYVQRVYSGMYLRDEILDRISQRILGRPLPHEEWRRGDVFGMMFTRNRGRASRRWRSWVPRPTTGATLTTNTVAVVAGSDAESEITYCVRIGVSSKLAQEEFIAPIELPAGSWVVGMRLRIEDVWEPAAIIERKAAEWVYGKISVVERRDPALLTLDSPMRGELRIFPVTPKGRELELDIRMPKALADGDVIKIGDVSVRHESAGVEISPVYANGVLVLPETWKQEHTSELLPINPGRLWVAVDCSVSNSLQKVDAIASDIVKIAEEAGAGHISLMAANAETRTTELATADLKVKLPEALLEFQGGLDAFGAVYRIIRVSEREGEIAKGNYPNIVLYGGNWANALERVELRDWGLLHDAAPGLNNLKIVVAGDKIDFAVPGANPASGVFAFVAGEERRVAEAEGDSFVVFTSSGELEGVEGLVDVKTDAEEGWDAGAEAWRLQFEMNRNPARDLRRDILRQSRLSGTLTEAGAYIVVENDAQRKMLQEKQRQALAADPSFDFEEDVPAPGVLMLVAAVSAVFFFLRLKSRHS